MSDLQDDVCACARACDVEIKPGMLRAACLRIMYAFGRAYSLPYKMSTFPSKQGLLYGLYNDGPIPFPSWPPEGVLSVTICRNFLLSSLLIFL